MIHLFIAIFYWVGCPDTVPQGDAFPQNAIGVLSQCKEVRCRGTLIGWNEDEPWRRRFDATSTHPSDKARLIQWLNHAAWKPVEPPPEGPAATGILVEIVPDNCRLSKLIIFGAMFGHKGQWYEVDDDKSPNAEDFFRAYRKMINAADSGWKIKKFNEPKPRVVSPRKSK
ncbi:hypothetical protein GCM10023213_25390 [Prosthecobacter algae]|uniref:Uncharacterized protein n=1 Tax=Prosthecobacter algae TaxID=1144682 RepID=A0ABP9P6A9_9BACT